MMSVRCATPLATLLALCFTSSCLARTIYNITYQADVSGFSLSATQELQQINATDYSLTTRMSHFLGKIEEVSEFSENGSGQLYSTRYHYLQKLLGVKRSKSLSFDWTAKQAHFIGRKRQEKFFALPTPAMDRASQQEYIRRKLLQGKTAFSVPLVDHRGYYRADYQVVAEEDLRVNNQTIRAVKLTRTNDKKNRQMFFWFSKDKHCLLLQLQQLEEGKDPYELRATAINQYPS